MSFSGTKTKISRVGNNLGGLYDTSQTELCPHREWNSPEEFLYDPSAMNVTPARTDAPKFYEIADSVLCSFSKVNAIFSYYLSSFLFFDANYLSTYPPNNYFKAHVNYYCYHYFISNSVGAEHRGAS